MNRKMSDEEKKARIVPPSVPEDQRQEVVARATSRVNSAEGVSAAEAWREGYVAGQVDMDRWTRNEYGYTKNPYEEGMQ